jgi:hypothetical protein
MIEMQNVSKSTIIFFIDAVVVGMQVASEAIRRGVLVN